MTEVGPCPFCGQRPHVIVLGYGYDHDIMFIRCKNPTCPERPSAGGGEVWEVIERWNDLRKEVEGQTGPQGQQVKMVNGFMVRFGDPIDTVEASVAHTWDIRGHITQGRALEMASTRDGLVEAAEMRFGHRKGVEMRHGHWPLTILSGSHTYVVDVTCIGLFGVQLVQPDDAKPWPNQLFPAGRDVELWEHALDRLRDTLLDYASEEGER